MGDVTQLGTKTNDALRMDQVGLLREVANRVADGEFGDNPVLQIVVCASGDGGLSHYQAQVDGFAAIGYLEAAKQLILNALLD